MVPLSKLSNCELLGSAASAKLGEPLRVDGIAHHMAIEIRQPVVPPHWPALTQTTLGAIYRGPGSSFGYPILVSLGCSDRPTGLHQLAHELRSLLIVQCRI